MMLREFLQTFEEEKALRDVTKFLQHGEFGHSKAEFLEYFMHSAFQPVVERRGNRLETVGYEAFVRPVAGGKDVSASDFLDNLTTTNAALAYRICRELHVRNFLNGAQSHEFISINIEADLLHNEPGELEEFAKEIVAAEKAGLSPLRIQAELKISPEIDPGIMFSFVTRLRELGVLTVLENFDADCASISRLIQCRPDSLKFNRSWILMNGLHPQSRHLVASVVKSVRTLGIKTHLEWVETKEDLHFGLQCGFDRFQGHFIAEPNELKSRPIFNLVQR